jgi:hypothetical protein
MTVSYAGRDDGQRGDGAKGDQDRLALDHGADQPRRRHRGRREGWTGDRDERPERALVAVVALGEATPELVEPVLEPPAHGPLR